MYNTYRINYRFDTDEVKEFRTAFVCAQSEIEACQMITDYHITDKSNPYNIGVCFTKIETMMPREICTFFEDDGDYKIFTSKADCEE